MSSRFDTQDKLIAATREIIIYEGIEGFTLDNVCSRAGFSRGAFYSNFSTKDALLLALAEDEYQDLIIRLKEQVEQWRTRAADRQVPGLMEELLFEALDAIGVNRALYLTHSELLTRSVRDPDWGRRLLDLNGEFMQALSDVLERILELAGRQPTRSIRALTHTVIGIVLRAASIDALRMTAKFRAEQLDPQVVHPELLPLDGQQIPDSQSVADSPARDVVEMVLVLLYACSRPQ